MPRYVILYHVLPEEDPRESHWDLMLESNGVLRTWALAERPDVITEDNFVHCIKAEKLPEHRIAYLEYEGEVSDNRGSVTQWDAGEYELLEENADFLLFNLLGKQLAGRWCLRREEKASHDYWLLGRL